MTKLERIFEFWQFRNSSYIFMFLHQNLTKNKIAKFCHLKLAYLNVTLLSYEARTFLRRKHIQLILLAIATITQNSIQSNFVLSESLLPIDSYFVVSVNFPLWFLSCFGSILLRCCLKSRDLFITFARLFYSFFFNLKFCWKNFLHYWETEFLHSLQMVTHLGRYAAKISDLVMPQTNLKLEIYFFIPIHVIEV